MHGLLIFMKIKWLLYSKNTLSIERECCFGAGDCEGLVRPGPVLCVNVPPPFFLVFVVGILF